MRVRGGELGPNRTSWTSIDSAERARSDAAAAYAESPPSRPRTAEGETPRGEQRRGHERADARIAPVHRCVGQRVEDRPNSPAVSQPRTRRRAGSSAGPATDRRAVATPRRLATRIEEQKARLPPSTVPVRPPSDRWPSRRRCQAWPASSRASLFVGEWPPVCLLLPHLHQADQQHRRSSRPVKTASLAWRFPPCAGPASRRRRA